MPAHRASPLEWSQLGPLSRSKHENGPLDVERRTLHTPRGVRRPHRTSTFPGHPPCIAPMLVACPASIGLRHCPPGPSPCRRHSMRGSVGSDSGAGTCSVHTTGSGRPSERLRWVTSRTWLGCSCLGCDQDGASPTSRHSPSGACRSLRSLSSATRPDRPCCTSPSRQGAVLGGKASSDIADSASTRLGPSGTFPSSTP